MAPPQIQPLSEYTGSQIQQVSPAKTTAQKIAETVPKKAVEYLVEPDGQVNVISPDGDRWGAVPEERAVELLSQGWVPMTAEQRLQAMDMQYEKEKYDAPGEAFVTGAMRGITFGAIDALADPATREHYNKLYQANPKATLAGEIASYVMPNSAVGKLGKAAAKGVEKLVGTIAAKGAGKAAMKAAGTLEMAIETQLMKNSVPKIAASATAKKIAGDILERNVAEKIAGSEIAGTVASGIARGAGEGAAIGLQTEITGVSLSDKPRNIPANIIQSALTGAALGGALSLGGLAVKKAAGAASNKIFSKQKDIIGYNKEISILKKEQELLVPMTSEEVKAAKLAEQTAKDGADWAIKMTALSNARKALAANSAVEAKIDKLTEKILSLNEKKSLYTQSFAESISKHFLRKIVLGGVGAGGGAYAGGITGGIVGATIGAGLEALWAIPGTKMFSYKALRVIFGETPRAIFDTVGRDTAIKLLSPDEIDDIDDATSNINTNILKNDNYIGYREGGLSEIDAEAMAQFQKDRIDMLKDASPKYNGTMIARSSYSKLADGIENPSRSLTRVLTGKGSKEDVRVIKTLLPEIYNKLRELAKNTLETERNISAEDKKIINDILEKSNGAIVYQQLAYGPPQEAGPKSGKQMKSGPGRGTPTQAALDNLGG